MDFDGYDIDWEVRDGHGSVTKEGTSLVVPDNDYENIVNFVKEMAKYFDPVGAGHLAKTQTERQANLKVLSEASIVGYHAKKEEYIDKFKLYLPANHLIERYYFCVDVPYGVPLIFGRNSQTPLGIVNNAPTICPDRHFMQDYGANGVSMNSSHPPTLGGLYYSSISTSYQVGNSRVMIQKGEDVKVGRV